MLLTRTRQLYFPIRTSGGGLYNYSIEGKGIFQDSIKTIGKRVQPRAIKTKALKDKDKLLKRTKEDFSPKITAKSKEILEKLIYGDGLKLLK